MSYVKDHQGIIINTDDSHYRAILAQRQSQKQSEALCGEMDMLKTELADIKSLLQQVITNRN